MRTEDWCDLMVDEFKRIMAICHTPTGLPVSAVSEIRQLCDRAVSNTKQHVPVIEQRDAYQSRVHELEAKLASMERLLGAVQLAYRKHHLGDETIGWTELSDELENALCYALGEDGYQQWLKNGES